MDCHSSTYACRDGIENRFPVVQLLGTAINLIYRFNLHMHYNQLISILTGSGYSMDGDITFIFIAQMDKSMVGGKCIQDRNNSIMLQTHIWLVASIWTGSMLMLS